MTVGWDTDEFVARWPGRPPLDGDASADACVIGLGGSGLAAIGELARRGLSVIGLDAGRVAAGAAGRNGGFLLGGGAPALHIAERDWGVEPARALYRATLTELDRLAGELGPDVVRRVGSIRLAGLPGPPTSAAEGADRLLELTDCRAQEQALRAAGIAVERYDGPLGQGLFLPDDAAMNPARRALAQAQQLPGAVRLHEGTRVSEVRSGRVTTDGGVVSAGVVIVAVDGGLERLVPVLAGVVRTARLQMLATEAGPAGRLPCPVYGRWGYDYAQQDVAGRVYCGGGRDRFADQEWTDGREPTTAVQAYLDSLTARMTGAALPVTHRWAAAVGYTADGRAVCGPVGDRIVACGGYSGTGNLVGSVAARAAVALAVDGSPPPAYFRSSLE
jgi:glycine/D-amino acid oxidase-like deaminating enzyme